VTGGDAGGVAANSALASERSSASFRAAAGAGLLRALDDDVAVVFAVDRDQVLHYVNPAWFAFALANDGQRCLDGYSIGTTVGGVIPEVLRPFYAAAYDAAFASGEAWTHLYECSSPSIIRSLRMRVAPLLDGSHLVVSNAVIGQRPAIDHGPGRSYVNARGMIIQCAHCRRCRRSDEEAWDFVSHHVEHPSAATSHGLCPPCLEQHYPKE
jgi:hypothetical protein